MKGINKTDILIRAACYSTGIDSTELFSKSRNQKIVFTRYLVAVTANKKLGMSLRKSGKLVGINKATVIHARKNLERTEQYGTGEEVLWLRIFNVMVGEF